MARIQPVNCGSLYSANGFRKYLNETERIRFIAAATRCPRADVGTFCLTLAFTGCRISEALALTASGIELAESCIALRSLKKRKKAFVIRQVPVPPDLLKTISKVHHLVEAKPENRLWPWSRSRAWQLVKAVMQEAAITSGLHATPKGLRHGFGLHAVRCSVPLNLVQRWLGHARMETTAIYLQAVGAEEREIAARMWPHASEQKHWRCPVCHSSQMISL